MDKLLKNHSILIVLTILILLVTFLLFLKDRDNGRTEEGAIAGNNTELNTLNENLRSKVTITTVFDNYPYKKGLKTGYGFSCLVEIDNIFGKKSLLFDTGADKNTQSSNLSALNLNISELDLIFLSHSHVDHVGGLTKMLELSDNAKVVIPASFPKSLKTKIKAYKADYREVTVQEKISDSAYTTGEMGVTYKEQSLILVTEKGLVVVTGCAHPGIVDIVKKAKGMFPGMNIYLVMGGYHLGSKTNREVKNIVSDFRKMGVENVAPSHCSGETARKLFREEYKNNFWENGVGRVFEI